MQLSLPPFLQWPLGRLPWLDSVGSLSRYQCWHESGRDGRPCPVPWQEGRLSMLLPSGAITIASDTSGRLVRIGQFCEQQA